MIGGSELIGAGLLALAVTGLLAAPSVIFAGPIAAYLGLPLDFGADGLPILQLAALVVVLYACIRWLLSYIDGITGPDTNR